MGLLLIFGMTAVAVAIIVIAVMRHDAKVKSLVAVGKCANRERTFWMQQTVFASSVGNIDNVYAALDKGILHEFGIVHGYQPGDSVSFALKVPGGSFSSALRAAAPDGDKMACIYQIEQYSGTGGYMKPKCLVAANVLLTAIEKAFYYLDGSAYVTRHTATFQSY